MVFIIDSALSVQLYVELVHQLQFTMADKAAGKLFLVLTEVRRTGNGFFLHIPKCSMNSREGILAQVKKFADEAHGDQTRKYSEDRYIVHPIRVMQRVEQYSSDIAMLAAALLHDVLEDTPVTKKQLDDFLQSVMDAPTANRTLKFVEELTDIYIKGNFPSLNRRSRKTKEADRLAKVSSGAQTIKYADIIDNTDVTRQDPDFAVTYLHEAKELIIKMKDGHRELRTLAMETVHRCLTSLQQEKNVQL